MALPGECVRSANYFRVSPLAFGVQTDHKCSSASPGFEALGSLAKMGLTYQSALLGLLFSVYLNLLI